MDTLTDKQVEERRPAVRRSVLILVLLALGFYLGFFLMMTLR